MKQRTKLGHTEAPWEIERCLDGSLFVKVGERLICMQSEGEELNEEDEANAKLIKSSPLLLAALIQLYNSVKDIPEVKHYLDGNLIQAKDAIHSATR